MGMISRCLGKSVTLVIVLAAWTGAGAARPSALPLQGQAVGPQDEVKVLAEEARQDLIKKDYAAAIGKYERLAQMQPQSAGMLNNLGIAYKMAGQLRDAAQSFERALRLESDLLSANLLLGITYIQLNEPVRAIPPLERALRRDGTHRDALLALASANYALKRFDAAVKVYQREVTIRPEDADAWYGMGLCFEHLAEGTTRRMVETAKESYYTQRITGDYLTEQDAPIDAGEAFRRALAAGGEREGLRAALGFAHLRLGEFAQAGQEFSHELRLHPANPDGKLGLAALALERGDYGAAARGLCEVYTTDPGFYENRLFFFLASLREEAQGRAAANLEPDRAAADCAPALDLLRRELTSSKSVIQMKEAFTSAPVPKTPLPPLTAAQADAARAADQAGRYAECVATLQEGRLAASEDALRLARCACLTGRFFVAFDTARAVLDREPANPAAQYWQAESTRRLAQAAFQRAMSLNPDSWQGHILLGDIHRQRKKWDQAVTHYQAAARLKPTAPGAFLGLGSVYWQVGKNAEAEAALRKAAEMIPDNPMLNFVLGDVLVRQRRFEEAIVYLERHLANGGNLLTAHGDLGKAFAALGRTKEAIRELRLALPSDEEGTLHYQLHTLYKKQGQMELARQALAESEKIRARALAQHQERTGRAGAAAKEKEAAPAP